MAALVLRTRKIMRVAWRHLLFTAFLAQAPIAAAAENPPAPAFFAALRQADLRVATMAYRLTTSNAALCRTLQPALGMPLHALDQYAPDVRAAADTAFGFETAVAVEDVVPGAPAATAGVQAGDSIVSLNGTSQPAKPGPTSTVATAATRIAAEGSLMALPPNRPFSMIVRRAGQDRTLVLQPVPGCRTGVEMMLGEGYDADSDGEKIRIGSRFLEDFDDNQVAVVIAHELAHTILEHRRRLEAAKVSYGLLAEVGRNGRLWRQTEDDADRLSVYLLYNAGYDSTSAASFWRGKGAKISGGIFRSRTHAGPNSRAQTLAAEAAKIAPGTTRPIMPIMLAQRDQPLR